jgi:hypothetical protein
MGSNYVFAFAGIACQIVEVNFRWGMTSFHVPSVTANRPLDAWLIKGGWVSSP